MKREITTVDFGLWLKAKRKERGYRQADVARLVGCHYNSITRWETGTQFPPLDVVDKMCRVFDAELIIREPGYVRDIDE